MAGKRTSGKARNPARPGFYSRALTEAERLQLEEASRVEGLDEEISLLRLRLRELAATSPESIDVQLKVARAITSMMRTRYQISKEEKKSLKDAIANVLQEIAAPLGIGVGMGVGIKAVGK